MSDNTETTPLLASQVSQRSGNGESSTEDNSWQQHTRKTLKFFSQHLRKFATLYLCGLFVLVVDFPGFMQTPAIFRVYELAICRDYYRRVDPSVIDPNGYVAEKLCKLSQIQKEVSKLKAIQATLDEFAGLLLVIPYGLLADTYGRKLVLYLSLIGILLSDAWTVTVLRLFDLIPTRVCFTSTVFRLIGGGNPVIIAVLLALMSDVCPPELRTTVFFYFQSTFQITELISPPIGKLLLESLGPYNIFLVTIPTAFLGLFVLLLLPETLKREEEEDSNTEGVAKPNFWISLKAHCSTMLQHVRHGLIPMLRRPTLLFGLLAFTMTSLIRPILNVIMQYVSVVFEWPLADAGLLMSVQAAVQLFLLITILPYVMRLLIKKAGSTQTANLHFAQGSTIFMAVGALVMALSSVAPMFIIGLVIYLLGTGFTAALRSWITDLVPKDETAVLYTIMTIFGSIGAIGGTPLLFAALAFGFERGGALTGLPFFVTAGLFVSVSAITFCLRPVRKIEEAVESSETE